MKLQRVILKNVGVFQGVRAFDLDENVVVIYGNNFSGKTTLVRALYFALCGKVFTGGIKATGLITSGESSATAGVVYAYNNDVYRLYRSTKGDLKTERYQGEQWRPLNSAQSPLPALNPYQWQMSCFLHEEELGEFLTKIPSKRRDLLNQLLGIDRLLSVQQAFIKVRRLAKRLEKAVLSQQETSLFNLVEDCTEELAACRARVTLLEEQLLQLGDNSGNQRLYSEWKQQQEAVQNRLHTLTDEHESLLDGFAHREELSNTLQQLTAQLAGREQSVQEAEIRKEKRIRLASQLQHVEELLGNLRGLQGQEVCPTCLQPLSETHVHRLEALYQEQSAELKARLDEAVAAEQEARKAVELFDQLARRETELSQRHDKLVALEKNMTDVRTQLETLQTKLASISDEGAVHEKRTKVERELEHTRAHLKQLELQAARFEEQQQHIATLNTQSRQATHHRLLSEWIADAVELTLQAIIGTSLQHVEERVITCLKEFRVLKSSLPSLHLETSQLMPELDGRMFRMLSGSEKAILYLSMKMAISQLMPGTDFVVLDNPTLHLDDLRREQMRAYLLDLALHKQVIIMTNDRIFADDFHQAKRINLLEKA